MAPRLLSVFLLTFLAACSSPRTKNDLAIAERSLARAQTRIEITKESDPAYEALAARLERAQARVDRLKSKAAHERLISGTGAGARFLEYASPIASIFLPALGSIFTMAAGGLGKIRDRLQVRLTGGTKNG